MNTDFLKDKTIKVAKGTLKTGGIIVETGKDIGRTARTHSAHMIINYTPDMYDELQDVATDGSKMVAGNSVMVGRTGLRINRSLLNVWHSSKQKKQIANFQLEQAKYNKLLKEYQFQQPSLTARQKKQMMSQLVKHKNNMDALQKKAMRQQKKIHKERGFSLKNSTIGVVSNQSRKALYRIGSQEDIGSKAVSKGGLAIWGTVKYRKQAAQILRKTALTIKGLVTSFISFATSVPVIIGGVISTMPIVAVLIVVISVFAFFGADLEFSGRVLNFSEKEIKLENAYQTALIPDELLAISQTLGWTTQDVEDYEVLLAFAYDQERGRKPSFEKMMDNVFNKYNPAKHFVAGNPIDEAANSGYKYYHNDEAQVGNLWNESVKRWNIVNSQWLETYPEYKNASIKEKQYMKTDAYIQEQKKKCRELLEKNAYNYLGSFLQLDSKPNIFKAQVVDISQASMSSAVGYRKLEINDTTDTSFHHGTDIPAPRNTRVNAVMDGKVVYADGTQTKEGDKCGLWGSGNSVIIRKDIFDSKGNPCYLYVMTSHLDPNSVRVKTGQKVSAGTHIAGVGTTGYSTGPHVHFQVWISTKKIDKMQEYHWVDVSPKKLTDSKTGKTYTVDTDNYHIYLDGLMFYDVEYRNKLFGR